MLPLKGLLLLGETAGSLDEAKRNSGKTYERVKTPDSTAFHPGYKVSWTRTQHSVLLHILDDLQGCASRVFNKSKLGKAHVCWLDDEFYTFVSQFGDCRFKVVNGQANVITHPSVNLLRDSEWQTV